MSAVTVFVVASSRGAKVAKELLGEAFAGILTTDRWAAYNWVDVARRQICWSHLLRDFQSWVDGGELIGSGLPTLHFPRWLPHRTERIDAWDDKVGSR